MSSGKVVWMGWIRRTGGWLRMLLAKRQLERFADLVDVVAPIAGVEAMLHGADQIVHVERHDARVQARLERESMHVKFASGMGELVSGDQRWETQGRTDATSGRRVCLPTDKAGRCTGGGWSLGRLCAVNGMTDAAWRLEGGVQERRRER